jgi:hypothetical protein
VGAAELDGRGSSGAGVFAAGVVLFRCKCSLIGICAPLLVAVSAGAVVEQRRDGGQVAGGVWEALREAVAVAAAATAVGVGNGAEAVADVVGQGGADGAPGGFEPVGDGDGVGFFEVPERAARDGSDVEAPEPAAGVIFVHGPADIAAVSRFVSTIFNRFGRRFLFAGFVVPVGGFESGVWLGVTASVTSVSSGFLFFCDFDFSLSLVVTAFSDRNEELGIPGTP